MEELEPCLYGKSIVRACHIVHGIRTKRPDARIMATKTDLKSAYRRLHAYAKTAAVCIAMISTSVCHIMLRLPFGASAAPAIWCLIFEMIVDLSNKLLRTKKWNPKVLYAL